MGHVTCVSTTFLRLHSPSRHPSLQVWHLMPCIHTLSTHPVHKLRVSSGILQQVQDSVVTLMHSWHSNVAHLSHASTQSKHWTASQSSHFALHSSHTPRVHLLHHAAPHITPLHDGAVMSISSGKKGGKTFFSFERESKFFFDDGAEHERNELA